jgi:hypothetical protein
MLMGWPEARWQDPPRAYATEPRPRHAPLPPVPAYERHPLVDEAIALMRPYERAELGGDMDSIALDLIGAYCVGELACRGGGVALRAERTRYGRDRKWLVFGSAITDGLER